jgi:hypothetical protein
MFSRVIRFSMAKGEDEAIKIYDEQAKPMWSKQQGFHSMQRFRIIRASGSNNGQRHWCDRTEAPHD